MTYLVRLILMCQDYPDEAAVLAAALFAAAVTWAWCDRMEVRHG